MTILLEKNAVRTSQVRRVGWLGLVALSSLLLAFFILDNSSHFVAVDKKFKANDVKLSNFSNNTNYTAAVASTDYIWVGNHWIPPPDVPYFSPEDLRLLFRSESTVWWGDSTARQDYQTMYAMVNAHDMYNIPIGDLNRNINKGKATKAEFYCSRRSSLDQNSSDSNVLVKDLGQVLGTNCSNSSSPRDSIGKLDYFYNNCYKHILSDLPTITSILQRDYSIIIFSLGVHEDIGNWDCRTTKKKKTPSYLLIKLLNALNLVSGHSLYVIWKTQGSKESPEPNELKSTIELTETARNWFSTEKPRYMGLSDFSSALVNGNKTFGPNRIKGDLKAHWGLEARTLSVQMASQLVYTKVKL